MKHSPDVCDSERGELDRAKQSVTQIDRATGKLFEYHKTSAIRTQAYQLQQRNVYSLIAAALLVISFVYQINCFERVPAIS
jgi:hypothetical protein